MDNAGDWLYIVFLIIAGISGLLNSKNKKKNRPDILGQPGREIVPNDEPSQGKGFWEVWEEVKKAETLPQPKALKKTQKQKAAKAKVSPSSSPFLAEEKKIPEKIAADPLIQVDVTKEELSILPDDSFQNINELKKAIIYSEILNRKY